MKDDEWIEAQRGASSVVLPAKGVFIVNEGNFMYGNSSLSFYDPKKEEVQNDLFFKINALPLGDVAQSMKIHLGLGYIVVNNSGKVYIINVNSGKYVGKITGLTSPRYIHFVNNKKAYITDLYASAITIINPETETIIGTIPTEGHASTEEIVQFGNTVFISCWSYDNTILVIDSQTDQIINQIKTGKQPSGMAIDKFNKLWVLCDGGMGKSDQDNRTAVLQKFNAQSRIIEKEFFFPSQEKPTKLCIDQAKENLFFINKGIWKMSVNSEALPALPLIPSEKNLYYGLGVDPETSEIYFSDAIDYLQKGIIYRCTSIGARIDSFKTGIIPGSFCFK
jgi:YVTN family beta-propeller protein